MNGSRPTIFISAGEPSGDIHGARVARALRERLPDVRLIGLGGPRLAAEGTELLADVEELALMGFTEVVQRLPFFLRLRRRVFATLEREAVDLVLPIDYPGFNLRLARRARERAIPVLYFIAPQVWAWHASRARELARNTTRIAVILPFEEAFLRRAGANAEFVGHPLVDAPVARPARQEWAREWGLDARQPVLALFPGSRRQEVERHLELFMETADLVVARFAAVQPVLAGAPDLPRSLYRDPRYPVVDSTSGLLQHAQAALVKSGTTTLEGALAKTPMVVAYRMGALTYQIARRVVRVPHIALANLVADARVAPEFVQHDATPAKLAEALLPLLDAGSEERRRMVDAWEGVRAALGESGAPERVADMAVNILEERRVVPA